jgi:putative transposase
MKLIKTAKLRILSRTKSLEPTLKIYRSALAFYIDVAQKEWENIKTFSNNRKMLVLENLTHETKQHPMAKYAFDKSFYKFPIYLRRACIMEAMGAVRAYASSLENWKKEKAETLVKGKKFHKKVPSLQLKHNAFPVFYKYNMFLKDENGKVKIKIFLNKDWVWTEVLLKDKELLVSKKPRFSEYAELSPKLVKKDKKFYLYFPYEKEVELSKKKEIVIGVDLGLTNTAVASALTSAGTVLGRLFINQPKEKDRFKHVFNTLAKAQSISGCIKAPNYWRKLKALQKEITQSTANQLVAFAQKYGATVIVFEHLGKLKPPKGFYGAKKLRFKLQFWAKQTVFQKTLEKAHTNGLRVARVLAAGTSKYAFDGSGEVVRKAKKNLAIFKTGKIYASDLSASYNIGARYFLKELKKTTLETIWLQAQAKVPELVIRTRQTLASLIKLQAVLNLTVNNTAVACI